MKNSKPKAEPLIARDEMYATESRQEDLYLNTDDTMYPNTRADNTIYPNTRAGSSTNSLNADVLAGSSTNNSPNLVASEVKTNNAQWSFL